MATHKSGPHGANLARRQHPNSVDFGPKSAKLGQDLTWIQQNWGCALSPERGRPDMITRRWTLGAHFRTSVHASGDVEEDVRTLSLPNSSNEARDPPDRIPTSAAAPMGPPQLAQGPHGPHQVGAARREPATRTWGWRSPHGAGAAHMEPAQSMRSPRPSWSRRSLQRRIP